MANNIVEIDTDKTVVIEVTETDISVVEPVINLITQTGGGGGTWGSITGDLADQEDLSLALSDKVDKVTGKALSTNDYTTDEKNKLSGIEAGAQVNVPQLQAAWDEGNIESVQYIQNKPTIPTSLSELSQTDDYRTVTTSEINTWNSKQDAGTYSTDIHNNITALNAVSGTNTGDQDLSNLVVKEAGKVLSSNDFKNDDKNKLDGIATGAEVNVQSDWDVTDTNSDAYIKNKIESISGGAFIRPTLTDNGDGSITVNPSSITLFNNNIFTGYPKVYSFGQISLTPTDNVTNYVVADYNAGNPIIRLTLNVTEITESNIVPLFTIYRNGIYLHILDWDTLGKGLVNKLHQSIVKTQRYRRESGLAISEYGTRNVSITAGKVWLGANVIDLSAIASATDGIFFWYHSASVWTQSVITQYSNSQYDNGTNLVSLNPNRYAVNWIFRGVENPKHLYMVLGNGDYTETQARNSQVPNLPPAISSHAILVGRIIIQNGGSSGEVQSAFDITFTNSAPTIHNNLSGLNDGEYKHLTASEYSGVTKDTVFVNASDFKGGTSSAYQSLVISTYPYIIKKFDNISLNTAYFDLNLSQLKPATQVRYRVKYILAETTMPTVGLTTILSTLGGSIIKTYLGTETQNTIIITDWSSLLDYSNTNTLTITGTYAQRISILNVEVEYSRGV